MIDLVLERAFLFQEIAPGIDGNCHSRHNAFMRNQKRSRPSIRPLGGAPTCSSRLNIKNDGFMSAAPEVIADFLKAEINQVINDK